MGWRGKWGARGKWSHRVVNPEWPTYNEQTLECMSKKVIRHYHHIELSQQEYALSLPFFFPSHPIHTEMDAFPKNSFFSSITCRIQKRDVIVMMVWQPYNSVVVCFKCVLTAFLNLCIFRMLVYILRICIPADVTLPI